MELKREKKFKKSSLGLFGLIVISVGIIIISYDFVIAKKEKAFKDMNLKLFENETPIVANDEDFPITENNIEENQEQQEEQQTPKSNYDYIGILEIPNIDLKQGFLDINSKYNNVDYNITVVQTSTYPDVDKGNLILAAHSGTSYISYFKNLYKLNNGDKAYIYYKGIKYEYQIVNIYNVEKTGKVSIYRNNNETVLTLITCTKDSDTEQTVYILELINKENI